MFEHDIFLRKTGQSKYTSQRQELDQVQIVSGVFEGMTTGTPIHLMVDNIDHRSRDYSDLKHVFRPGHADYTYDQKYGHRDYRGGGRSSARETIARVMAGVIAKKLLKERYNVDIFGYVSQIGIHILPFKSRDMITQNPFMCPNDEDVSKLEEYFQILRKQCDSVGARIEVCALDVPVGLGAPVFDKLDADIAKAMMSINAVKGVSIGDGFDVVSQKGSEHRDEMSFDAPSKFISNHSGGILGGISNGETIRVSLAFKPTSSIPQEGCTINDQGENAVVKVKGRHDPCVGLRAVVIAEAMLAIVLIDHMLRDHAQCGDVKRGRF